MFAITGITGQVGGTVARRLIERGARVRAVVRNASKADEWARRGCPTALADMTDANALAEAFSGTEGVFVLIPPCFDPSPGFPEVRAVIDALADALRRTTPGKVVCLSTIGAQASEPNLLSQLGLVERELGALELPVAFLRAAWFMENSIWDLGPAREGVFESYLQPLDKPLPMVATSDVGDVAAGLLEEAWGGRRVVELEGPRRITPNELGAALARAVGRDVEVRTVPRAEWEGRFRAGGARYPEPRARMLDGFNEGWIEFEGDKAGSIKGVTSVDAVLRDLAARG